MASCSEERKVQGGAVKTHQVENQVPPLANYNLYSSDAALRAAVECHGVKAAAHELTEFGALVGSEAVLEHGRLANENPPVLRAFDRNGHRINVVEYHPSYHELMALSMTHGLHAQPWQSSMPGRFVTRAAKTYMMTQVEAGHGCPITMTFASVPALRNSSDLAADWVPRLISCSMTLEIFRLSRSMRTPQDGDDRETGRVRCSGEYDPRSCAVRRQLSADRS